MHTKTYPSYIESFTGWLKVLGYSASTVYGTPRMLKEFFDWLEQNNIKKIEHITATHTEQFIRYTTTRANRRRVGGLSASHINRYIEVINKFNEYQKKVSGITIPINAIRLEDDIIKQRLILSTEEIKAIYKATDESHFGMRDRAMLAVYYGCGLRRSEGVYLDVSDVLVERQLLYIRKSKNNHQRYVPITTTNLNYIEQYIYNARPLLIGDRANVRGTFEPVGGQAEQGLFISERGRRISNERFYQRLQELAIKAGITKEIGIHTLRHSIATHLLHAGMELENIALFLGHRCLDSTQIYTHLVNEQ